MAKIRLHESQLNKIIMESIKKAHVNEYDEPFPYNYKDARERDEYFRRAVQHDFPMNASSRTGKNWEDTYYGLLDKKATDDKNRQKAERIKASDEKKKAAAQKKSDNERIRRQKNYKWAISVREALTGSDDANDDYDGLMDFPLFLQDGSKLMFHAHSFMEPGNYDNSIGQGGAGMSREYDGFTFRVAGTVDGQEETAEMPEISMHVTTYTSPMDVKVIPVVKGVDNIDRSATRDIVTKLAKKEAIKRYRQIMKANNV